SGLPLPLCCRSLTFSSPRASGFILLRVRALADPGGLAGRLELRGADVADGPVAVRTDQRLTAIGHGRRVVLRDLLRRQQEGRDIRRAVVGLRLGPGETP